MEFKNKPIGVLRIYHKKLQKFNTNDVALARLIASQCAVAITNARLFTEAIEGAKMSQQMGFAGEIQRRMIPQEPPKIKGLEVEGIYQPCFEVGGDLYDIIKLDDFSCLIVISDVIGKGIPAALMMSMFRGALRAYSHGGHSRHSLLEIISELNRIGCSECRDGEFITLFIALINTKEMKMKYCNCGHEPALLFRDGQFQDLDKGGLVLGVLPNTEYIVDTIDLHKKDVLLFYTDGLIDAVNFNGENWGRDNMINVASEFVSNSPETMLKNILAYRRRFVGLANQIDDTSMVAVKIKSDNNESLIPSKLKLKEMTKALKRKKKETLKKQEKYNSSEKD
jgi:sigma-B regulation protein RsbU (phosphoserine phosphatase)